MERVLQLDDNSNLILKRLTVEIDGLKVLVPILEDKEDKEYYSIELLARQDYRQELIRQIIIKEYPELKLFSYMYVSEEGKIEVYDKANAKME